MGNKKTSILVNKTKKLGIQIDPRSAHNMSNYVSNGNTTPITEEQIPFNKTLDCQNLMTNALSNHVHNVTQGMSRRSSKTQFDARYSKYNRNDTISDQINLNQMTQVMPALALDDDQDQPVRHQS